MDFLKKYQHDIVIAIIFAQAGIQAIAPMVPANWQGAVSMGLAALAFTLSQLAKAQAAKP